MTHKYMIERNGLFLKAPLLSYCNTWVKYADGSRWQYRIPAETIALSRKATVHEVEED